MIPQALLLPAGTADQHGGCYEVNHLGVTVRCEPEPRILRNVTRVVGRGEATSAHPDGEPIVQHIVGDPSDLLVPDFLGRGHWVVPAKYAAAFAEAYAAAEAGHKAEVARLTPPESPAPASATAVTGDSFANDTPRTVARRTRKQEG